MSEIRKLLKETWIEIRPNAYWDIIKWVVGGVIMIIGTLATTTWYYWQSVSPTFQVIFIIGLLWLLGVPIIYVALKILAARNKKDEVSKTSNILENEWLIKSAANQAENIDEFIYAEFIRYETFGKKEGIPFLIFTLRVFNTSVYEIIIDSEVGGDILFEGKRLKQVKSMKALSPVIEPNTRKDIALTQELFDDDMKTIKEAFQLYESQRDKIRKMSVAECIKKMDSQSFGQIVDSLENIPPPRFAYHRLQIIVKGNNEEEIKPKPLKIQKDSLELISTDGESFKILS